MDRMDMNNEEHVKLILSIADAKQDMGAAQAAITVFAYGAGIKKMD
jgi:hypothetical protein